MSRVRADRYTNSSGVGAPEFTHGAVMVGLVTASTLTATTLNVSGTLTYEDVTNVDSVGIITAQSGIRMGIGSTIGPASGAGIVTYYGDGQGLINVGSAASTMTLQTWLFGC